MSNPNSRLSIDLVRGIFLERGGILLSESYKNTGSKLEVLCPKGHRYLTTVDKARSGKGCSFCAGNAKKDLAWLIALPGARSFKSLAGEYVNNSTKYPWMCLAEGCGYTWESKASHIKDGSGCPKCARQQSKPETQIYDFVKNLYPDAVHGIRGLLKNKGFQLDIYVPSLRKAIEFDGYRWHKSEFAIKKNQYERDARKDRECEEIGVSLLRVCSLQFEENPGIVLDNIKDFLSSSVDSL